MPNRPEFRPVHQHPVTLAELSRLEPELLSNEIARLENSIRHLRRSNDEVIEFLDGDEASDLDGDSRAEFVDSVRDNDETIATQQERIAMIRISLEEQIGVQASNSHYSVRPDPAPTSTATTGTNQGDDEEEVEEVTGMTATRTRTQGVANGSSPVGAGGSRTAEVNGEAEPRSVGASTEQIQASEGRDEGMYL
ncbi:hypothetical protein JCM10212_002281 [Sporobolomyces blumeae]